MSIENLTIGQLKELLQVFNVDKKDNKHDMYQKMIGKYVICRTRNEGINAGVVVEIDETGVVLEECRRIYSHRPLDKKLSWYEGVAISGLSNSSEISNPTKKIIIENYSLTECTKEAEMSIREAKTNEQN